MNDQLEPVVLSSPLELDRARAALLATHEPFPAPSLFTTREERYEQAAVELDENGFRLSQRKSYVNLWAPTFYGRLVPGPQGTRIEGRFEFSSKLKTGLRLHYGCLAWSGAGLLTLLFQDLASGFNAFSVTILSVVMSITALYVVVSRACKKRYETLAQGEIAFLRRFLHDSLHAQEQPSESHAGRTGVAA